MTRDDERYMFRMLEKIREETHENNIMLKQICKVINAYLLNHNKENDNDFERNIIANLISNGLDFKNILK